MITFNHSGNLGDILYSLYFCRDFATSINQEKFNFHIQTNVKDPALECHKHPFGNVRMTEGGANFLLPLLKAQPYINEVTIGDNVPDKCINTDLFRTLKINFMSGDIRNWYYNLVKQHLSREFWKPVIFANNPDKKYENKILFSQTERYQNVAIDFSQLKQFDKDLIFVGTKEEYDRFVKLYFNLEYCPVDNMLTMTNYIAGAKGFCAGECGLYAVAECLKTPRILVAPELFKFNDRIMPGPHNVHPQGGWCEDVSTTEKLVATISELLNSK